MIGNLYTRKIKVLYIKVIGKSYSLNNIIVTFV